MPRTQLLMAFLLPAILAACDLTTDPKPADPIRVGAAVSLTGSLSVEGNDTRRGYELWAEYVNDERKGILVGGVRRKVELIIRDDASDATRSAQLVQELIDADSVDFLL